MKVHTTPGGTFSVRPFTVRVDQHEVDDLRHRLARTRWPDEIEGSGWRFGAGLQYMKDLIAYWQDAYDWRRAEAAMNEWPHFIASVDGYDIHVALLEGEGRGRIPLLLTHGWPGSFLEFTKLAPLLTQGSGQTFDLVIPSMLGFGFSQRVTHAGGNVRMMAGLWQKLMEGLGYHRFGAHGGDFGAGICTGLGLEHAESVLGIHLNYIPGSFVPYLPPGEELTPEEIRFEKDAGDWFDREGAYAHQHWTKPLTLAYGLQDSPAGLCAWIVEKLCSWADCDGEIGRVFTKDEILTHVSLYWFTGTVHSSIRLYEENGHARYRFGAGDRVGVPVGIARFPLEEPFPPRRYIERGYNITHWTDMPRGGHFAAMEQPELLARDIRAFFGGLTVGGA